VKLISVRHPHNKLLREACKKWRITTFYTRYRGFAIFTFETRGNLSSKDVG
jgi:hypothetical protein